MRKNAPRDEEREGRDIDDMIHRALLSPCLPTMLDGSWSSGPKQPSAALVPPSAQRAPRLLALARVLCCHSSVMMQCCCSRTLPSLPSLRPTVFLIDLVCVQGCMDVYKSCPPYRTPTSFCSKLFRHTSGLLCSASHPSASLVHRSFSSIPPSSRLHSLCLHPLCLHSAPPSSCC